MVTNRVIRHDLQNVVNARNTFLSCALMTLIASM
jgi:hypothetical protein